MKRGITLIEIMIIVAIIGILAAIAIPNFMVFHFMEACKEDGYTKDVCRATLTERGGPWDQVQKKGGVVKASSSAIERCATHCKPYVFAYSDRDGCQCTNAQGESK